MQNTKANRTRTRHFCAALSDDIMLVGSVEDMTVDEMIADLRSVLSEANDRLADLAGEML